MTSLSCFSFSELELEVKTFLFGLDTVFYCCLHILEFLAQSSITFSVSRQGCRSPKFELRQALLCDGRARNGQFFEPTGGYV